MNGSAIIRVDDSVFSAPCGTRLSELVLGEYPCAGHGKCGKCKAFVAGNVSELTDSEKKALTAVEIQNGMRLLCMTYALGDCEVVLPCDQGKMQILTGAAKEVRGDPTKHLGVAIDLGTTTLAATLYESGGTLLAECGARNPQARYGKDVISRIEASLSDREALRVCVLDAIDTLIFRLASLAGIDAKQIDRGVITGNTAMLYLLSGTCALSLSRAPFAADRLFGEVIGAEDLGLRSVASSAKIYLPPCIASYVGADTVCALIASGMTETDDTALLADIGTNGEIALFHDGALSVCSTAAGPAFEGVGIRMGMSAARGAIDRVSLVNGTLCCHVIDNVAPVGVCGSGLMDAVASLLALGEIDETGYMEEDAIPLAPPVLLYQDDVRMLQLAKSAIFSGIGTLLKHADLTPTEVDKLYLAGGFGNYLSMRSIAAIGLIPAVLCERAEAIGNAALHGAAMLLFDTSLRDRAAKIAENAKHISLASDPIFSDLYMTNMLFPE